MRNDVITISLFIALLITSYLTDRLLIGQSIAGIIYLCMGERRDEYFDDDLAIVNQQIKKYSEEEK